MKLTVSSITISAIANTPTILPTTVMTVLLSPRELEVIVGEGEKNCNVTEGFGEGKGDWLIEGDTSKKRYVILIICYLLPDSGLYEKKNKAYADNCSINCEFYCMLIKTYQ